MPGGGLKKPIDARFHLYVLGLAPDYACGGGCDFVISVSSQPIIVTHIVKMSAKPVKCLRVDRLRRTTFLSSQTTASTAVRRQNWRLTTHFASKGGRIGIILCTTVDPSICFDHPWTSSSRPIKTFIHRFDIPSMSWTITIHGNLSLSKQ